MTTLQKSRNPREYYDNWFIYSKKCLSLVHGCDKNGKADIRTQLKRNQVLAYLPIYPVQFDWARNVWWGALLHPQGIKARKLTTLDNNARLISPQAYGKLARTLPKEQESHFANLAKNTGAQ